MLSVQEAIDQLTGAAQLRVDTVDTEVLGARGRVLAEDVIAGIDVPPADNSAMDGYAFRRQEWNGPDTPLRISQRITAGADPMPLEPGTAARIFTGAHVPAGADSVVMQENTVEADGAVSIDPAPDIGANIRRRGQDIGRGAVILQAGHRLRPQDLGLIASVGVARVSCFRRLKVAVASSGDELVEPGSEAGPSQIYNSNRFTLTGLLSGWGYDVVDLGVAPDDPEAVRELLSRASREADVIVTSGGVSVGEEDHIKSVVEELGRLELWKIAIRPGKPFAFGYVGDTPILGLPGNPVSVFVTLLVVGRPYLAASQGAQSSPLRPLYQRAGFDKTGGSREDYLRVRLDGGTLIPYPSQSSGILTSTSWGDGLLRQPPGQDIRAGDLVEFYPWPLFD